MKKLIMLINLMLLVTSCGKSKHPVYIDRDVEVPVEVYKNQDFEGIYYLGNGSQIELVTGYDHEVHILKDNQIINTINPENQTFGTFPRFEKNGLEVINNRIFFTMNLNYNDGHDIEEDESGDNIRGKRKTDVLIEKTDNGIRIVLSIYKNKINDNINSIVAQRIYESL